MRIRNYPINSNITSRDMLIGTDVGGSTKNFLLSSLSDFITSGTTVSWDNVTNIPEATSATSGILTSATFNSFNYPSLIIKDTLEELQQISPHNNIIGVVSGTNKLYYYNGSLWVSLT